MSILPKVICGFNIICMKISLAFFTEIEKAILKLIWDSERFQIAKEVLRKRQIWRHHNSSFQIILQSSINKKIMTLI